MSTSIDCEGRKHPRRRAVLAVLSRADDGAWHAVDHSALHEARGMRSSDEAEANRKFYMDAHEPGDWGEFRPPVESGEGEERRFEFRCPLCWENLPVRAAKLEPILELLATHGIERISLASLRARLSGF